MLDYLTVAHFIALLRAPLVNSLIIPGLLLASQVLWKQRIRPAGPQPDDYALGIDLVLNAAGVQLSFLIGFAVADNQPAIAYGMRVLGGITLVFLSMVGLLRRWGFEADGKTPAVWTGRVIPDMVGTITLIAVFAGNTLGIRGA